MSLKLHVWRQAGPASRGAMKDYQATNVSPHMSFLEMLDEVNEGLTLKGEEPIAFDHDCREGICGMCSMVINGHPHGGQKGVTVCQLHMRHFKDGDEIWIEPWRAKAFPAQSSTGHHEKLFSGVGSSHSPQLRPLTVSSSRVGKPPSELTSRNLPTGPGLSGPLIPILHQPIAPLGPLRQKFQVVPTIESSFTWAAPVVPRMLATW